MILISAEAKAKMTENARKTYPDECCGFMFGKESGIDRLVDVISVVDNSKVGDKRRRFEISPFDYMKAEQFALDQDMALLGVYHSHPNHPAIPSEHDRIAAQPWFSYVIISVLPEQDISFRSWRLNEETQFEEENIANVQLT